MKNVYSITIIWWGVFWREEEEEIVKTAENVCTWHGERESTKSKLRVFMLHAFFIVYFAQAQTESPNNTYIYGYRAISNIQAYREQNARTDRDTLWPQ